MNKLHWFEAKQLDRVTNYSTEVEIIKYAVRNNLVANYYCSFSKEKNYFGLESNIKYLGIFHNKILKAFEFRCCVILKAVLIVFSENNSILMVNQELIKYMLPALLLNKIIKKKNKFIVDIRTTPTNPNRFVNEMKKFHGKFKYAVKCYDGFSFITPFMEKYVMGRYTKKNYKSVHWSSGVDVDLFNPNIFSRSHLKNGTFRLFYHGGISVSRGNLDLVKATELLAKDGYNIKLTQVGILVNREIVEYIADKKLESCCELLGPVALSQIPGMIAESSLPILPFPDFMAWRVSSPIKLMEYLAMGKKVLAPNMEAFTDVFGERSDYIFYFDTKGSNQVVEIYKSIKKVIDGNLLEGVNFFPNIREFVSARYTWEMQATKLFDFCDTL